MQTIFTVWLLLAAQANDVNLGARRLGPPQVRDVETFHRQHLEVIRRSQTFLREQIEWVESTWAPTTRAHELLRILRTEYEMGKRVERSLELWEQQRKQTPGAETDQNAIERLTKLLKEWEELQDGGCGKLSMAPMPREAKK